MMEKAGYQQTNGSIENGSTVNAPEGMELFVLGYRKAMKDVKARLLASRQKMIEAYRKGLDTVPDKEAYHGATTVIALEVETLIEELGKVST